jgi:hypothetical protein
MGARGAGKGEAKQGVVTLALGMILERLGDVVVVAFEPGI